MTFRLKTGLAMLMAGAVLATGLTVGTAAQAEWKPKKITVVLPHSLGGGQDRLTRAFLPVWEKHLGAKIEVKPKSGASGRVGFDFWQTQPRDGTVLASSAISTSGMMYAAQKPDWSWTDTMYILGLMGADPGAVFVLKNSKYKTIQDVIKDAKEKTVLMGISSWASTENITLHQLPELTGIKPMRIIPIGGGGDLVTAVLGEHLPVALGKVSNINKAKGKVRILAVTLDKNPIPKLTDDAPSLNKALGIDAVTVASLRAIIAPMELKKTHPDRLKKLKATFEAAKDDPAYIKKAAKVGVPEKMILDQDHEELQAQVNKFWAAFNKSGDFFKQKQKHKKMKVVLVDVKKKGKFILFKDENGKKWTTRIHRKKTKFSMNGEKYKGSKKIEKARSKLKAGDECVITYEGMPVVAKTASCTSSKGGSS
ncbi:MAG: tripartite tricarboxylate transporter substrate-binding protein [Rhodospirillales bacterium]